MSKQEKCKHDHNWYGYRHVDGICSICRTETRASLVIDSLKELIDDKNVILELRQDSMKFMAKLVRWEKK